MLKTTLALTIAMSLVDAIELEKQSFTLCTDDDILDGGDCGDVTDSLKKKLRKVEGELSDAEDDLKKCEGEDSSDESSESSDSDSDDDVPSLTTADVLAPTEADIAADAAAAEAAKVAAAAAKKAAKAAAKAAKIAAGCGDHALMYNS